MAHRPFDPNINHQCSHVLHGWMVPNINRSGKSFHLSQCIVLHGWRTPKRQELALVAWSRTSVAQANATPKRTPVVRASRTSTARANPSTHNIPCRAASDHVPSLSRSDKLQAPLLNMLDRESQTLAAWASSC